MMANDDPSGRIRLSERILALGLAGALLAELLLIDGAFTIDKGNLVRTGGRRPSHLLHDELCHEVEAENLLHDELCHEVEAEKEPRPVRDWLDYLSLGAVDRVGRRLHAAGMAYLKQPRLKMPGRAGRWTPVDMHAATWPAIDVARKVYTGTASTSTLLLFGLTHATGLDNPNLWLVRQLLTNPALLKETFSPLAAFDPAFVDLLAQTEAAVSSSVASQRRG